MKEKRTLGGRLRIARDAIGLTTREAEAALRATGILISHVTIGNYERGVGYPDAKVIEGFAKIYRRDAQSLLIEKPPLTGVKYRCLKSVREGEKSQFQAQGQAWLEAYLTVENLVGDPLRSIKQHFRPRAEWTGRELAEAVRKEYKFHVYPLPSTVKMAEEFGIRVIQLSTPARIDAFAGALGGAPVVVVNSNLPNDRIRLTVLHEVAHHLYEDCAQGDIPDEKQIERRAFEFASHVLIPDDQLAAAFSTKTMVQLVRYKERFGISLAAMIYRAGESGLISQRLYQKIWTDMSKLGLKVKEPGYVAPDRPVRMEAKIEQAVDAKLTTHEQIAGWVGVDVAEVHARIADAMGGSSEASSEQGPKEFQFRNYL